MGSVQPYSMPLRSSERLPDGLVLAPHASRVTEAQVRFLRGRIVAALGDGHCVVVLGMAAPRCHHLVPELEPLTV